MRCVAAILARNEERRYLRETIQHLQPLCTDILLLNDGSTDRTPQLAWDMGCQVKDRSGGPMWGQESGARQELWSWGSEVCGDGWLLICDADQELIAPKDVWEGMLTSWYTTAWSFPLCDTWDSPTQHRTDGFWQGHLHPRPWLFKPGDCKDQQWSERGIHTGHSPLGNWYHSVAPESVYWKHRGWEKPEDRAEKVLRYQQAADQLSPYEAAHLASVLET